MLNGGRISSFTGGMGKGGSATVNAQSIAISGATPDGSSPSGILAESYLSGQGGAAGDVRVTANGQLNLQGGGEISSSTGGMGKGGSVTVNAQDIAISGATPDGSSPSGILAESYLSGQGGAAGDVRVTANGQLNLQGGGEISSSTGGMGKGGSVIVNAQDITISGATPDGRSASGIFAQSNSSGKGGIAGGISVWCENLSLDSGGQISTKALANDAGDITIEAGSQITLEGQSSITASAGASGGNIFIAARDLLFLDHSSIVATAGTSLLAGARSGSGGAGGNIFIDPTFIILDHSTISANAAVGAGGNIQLQAQNFLASESPITATGSTAGSVQVTAPPLDLANALAALQGALVDASVRLQERCAMRLGPEFSSFLVVGRGSVEDSPDDPQAEIPARILRGGKGKVHKR